MLADSSLPASNPCNLVFAAILDDDTITSLYPLFGGSAQERVFRQAVEDGIVTGKGHEVNLLSLADGNKLLVVNVGKKSELRPDDLRAAGGYACGWVRVHPKVPRQVTLHRTTSETWLFGNDYQLIKEGWELRNDTVARSEQGKQAETDVGEFNFTGGAASEFVVTQQFTRGRLIAKLARWVRQIGNLRGSECPPRALVYEAHQLIKDTIDEMVSFPHGDILDGVFYNAQRFGAFLSVADGAKHEPAGLYVVYDRGIPGQQTLGLLGKAVTFDTGGFLRKPGAEAMNEMYLDKMGAVCLVALFVYLVSIKAPFKIVLMFNATENRDGTLPRDIVVSRVGQHIDVTHTDAEGRLTLVDGIDFIVEQEKPAVLFDLATLTGAAMKALGGRVAMFTTGQDQLQRELYDALQVSGLGFFPMPLPEQQGPELLKTGEADIKNSDLTTTYGAGSAAWFLAQSLGLSNKAHGSETVLYHLDMAGMMEVKKGAGYRLEGADPGAFIGLAHGLTTLIQQGWLKPVSRD